MLAPLDARYGVTLQRVCNAPIRITRHAAANFLTETFSRGFNLRKSFRVRRLHANQAAGWLAALRFRVFWLNCASMLLQTHSSSAHRTTYTTSVATAAPSCAALPVGPPSPPAALIASRAIAEPLDDFLGDTDRGDFGEAFDQASRTIHMPKATAPTLTARNTAQFTETAIKSYDDIVTRGGWPVVPKVDELRLGNRHPSVVDLRSRLAVSGDLDPKYGRQRHLRHPDVEEAVRRFQARHGLTVDGILRGATLDAMKNAPAATRRDQLNTY